MDEATGPVHPRFSPSLTEGKIDLTSTGELLWSMQMGQCFFAWELIGP